MTPETRDATDQVAELLELAGVPPRFVDRRFATFKRRHGATGALRVARVLAMQDVVTDGLVLLGSPGAGKTHCETEISVPRVGREPRLEPAAAGMTRSLIGLRVIVGGHDPNESLAARRGAGCALAKDMSARSLSTPVWDAEALA